MEFAVTSKKCVFCKQNLFISKNVDNLLVIQKTYFTFASHFVKKLYVKQRKKKILYANNSTASKKGTRSNHLQQ